MLSRSDNCDFIVEVADCCTCSDNGTFPDDNPVQGDIIPDAGSRHNNTLAYIRTFADRDIPEYDRAIDVALYEASIMYV